MKVGSFDRRANLLRTLARLHSLLTFSREVCFITVMSRCDLVSLDRPEVLRFSDLQATVPAG